MSRSDARVVVVLGAAGSGKSTLVDALLAAGGAEPATGGPRELRHGVIDGASRLHLLDPPGDPELPGPLLAALRAAGSALLVLAPLQGLDPRTVALVEACEEAGLPLVVAVTQLDRPGADADEAIALAQRLLGEHVLPVQLPLHDDDGLVAGLLDLLRLRVVAGDGERDADPEHVTLVEALREELLAAVLSGGDETVFERWLADGDEPEVLDLPAAVARGDLQPLVITSPRHGVGLPELLDLLAALPPAADRSPPAAADAEGDPTHLADDGPQVTEVIRTGLARVWAGPGTGDLVPADPSRLPGHLAGAEVVLAPWEGASAQFPVAVRPDAGLATRVAHDPLARLVTDHRSGQLLLWTTGPAHAEDLLDGRAALPVEIVGPRTGTVRVQVPDWCVRAVKSDATARGGKVLSQDPLLIRLPASELAGYVLALGRASGWTGTFSRESGPLAP